MHITYITNCSEVTVLCQTKNTMHIQDFERYITSHICKYKFKYEGKHLKSVERFTYNTNRKRLLEKHIYIFLSDRVL